MLGRHSRPVGRAGRAGRPDNTDRCLLFTKRNFRGEERRRRQCLLVRTLHNASGICPPVGFGKGAVIPCDDPLDLARQPDMLAHELGHYFGIASHVRDEGFNLMTRSSATSEGNLTLSQVEKVHYTLANSPARIRLREE